MDEKRLRELADKFMNGEASPSEEAELHAWWDKEMHNEDEQVVVTGQPETYESVRDRILGKLNAQIDAGAGTPGRIKKIGAWWMVAASLLVVVVALAILLPLVRKHQGTADSIDQMSEARGIKPGGNKAILQLSTGKTIQLDSTGEGILTNDSGADISRIAGDRLVYSASQHSKGSYNTIHTPKGGQYQVKLSDGSNVWLNAASSIRYPTVFGEERQVELSGEAYFEVAGDPRRPFKVVVSKTPGTPSCIVTVLGTEFDIDSYEDDAVVKTTLLKGSLRITSSATQRSELLKPGQQAVLDQADDLKVNEDADSGKAIAWKEGLFKFKNDSIEDIMRQMARWYDVQVTIAAKIPDQFVSTLPRNRDLYQDLQTLEKTGRVRFEVKGRSVTVFPR